MSTVESGNFEIYDYDVSASTWATRAEEHYAAPKGYVDSKVGTVIDNGCIKPLPGTETIKITEAENTVHRVQTVMQFCHPDISGHPIWRFSISEIEPNSGIFNRFQIHYNPEPSGNIPCWNYVSDFPYVTPDDST